MSRKKVQVQASRAIAGSYVNPVSAEPFQPGSVRGSIAGAQSNLGDLSATVTELEERMAFPPAPGKGADGNEEGPGSLSGVAADVRGMAQSLYYLNLRLRRIAEAI